jgi:four helix bundle protein
VRESRKLRIWHNARHFVRHAYDASSSFPADERYGLTSQLRRAALSILLNISEGAGRGSDREFARFLRIALGSAAEVEALVVVAADLEYLEAGRADALNHDLDEIRKMATRLLQVVSPTARS